MWNRIFCASFAAGVLVISTVVGASAEALNADQWTGFTQQQPVVSRVFVAHEASAVANLFGITVDQLKAEMAQRSLADAAAAHNRSASEVATVMIDTANRDLQLAATFGLISQASSADLKTQFEAVLPGLLGAPAPGALLFS
jgi:hypothetical protein